MDFPTLRGEAATGKAKLWRIRCEQRGEVGVIITEHGYEDGKILLSEKVVSAGKNIGKKNATTAFQQACMDARAAWQKKKDAGYCESACGVAGGAGRSDTRAPIELPTSRARAAATDEIPLPMLALDYNKRGKSIQFPCFIQRKYDGTRCVATESGLFSRNRKAYPNLGHIREEIVRICRAYPGIILDGELYSRTLTFQEIVGLVRRETLETGDIERQTQISFYCYDIIDTGATFQQRLNKMMEILRICRGLRYVRFVMTEKCVKSADLKAKHDQYVAEGFEGIMLRNADGMYRTGVRSADLQKYKEFQDSEFEVVGFTEGEGLEAGCVVWQCRSSKGPTFACRPRGSHEERRDLYRRAKDFVGKKLTVRYQELTDDGLPRFPVGIAFRDYE